MCKRCRTYQLGKLGNMKRGCSGSSVGAWGVGEWEFGEGVRPEILVERVQLQTYKSVWGRGEGGCRRRELLEPECPARVRPGVRRLISGR